MFNSFQESYQSLDSTIVTLLSTQMSKLSLGMGFENQFQPKIISLSAYQLLYRLSQRHGRREVTKLGLLFYKIMVSLSKVSGLMNLRLTNEST